MTCQSAWLDIVTTPVDKERMNACVLNDLFFWWISATRKIALKSRKCCLYGSSNVTDLKMRVWQHKTKTAIHDAVFWTFSKTMDHLINKRAKYSEKLFSSLSTDCHDSRVCLASLHTSSDIKDYTSKLRDVAFSTCSPPSSSDNQDSCNEMHEAIIATKRRPRVLHCCQPTCIKWLKTRRSTLVFDAAGTKDPEKTRKKT